MQRRRPIVLVPTFNEETNPRRVYQSLRFTSRVERLIFVDDGSDESSRLVLEELRVSARGFVTVVRNEHRLGKVASLLSYFRHMPDDAPDVILLDADVEVSACALGRICDALEHSDLVLSSPQALSRTGPSFWERGILFSASVQQSYREQSISETPALFSNGRLLGMSARLARAVLESDVPIHTEDAHFALVALTHGMRLQYQPESRVYYRAPSTARDFLRQSRRFSEGTQLLAERWPSTVLSKYYFPRSTIARIALHLGIHDPIGLIAWLMLLFAKKVLPAPRQTTTWEIALTTKEL